MRDEQKTKKQLIAELKQLRQSEIQYRLLAENVSDVIWTTDMHLRFTYVSPSVTRMLGYTPEELVSKSAVNILTPPSYRVARHTLTEELIKETMTSNDPSRIRTLEFELVCKDGSTVWTEMKMSFLRGADGRPTSILGVARDITERMRERETSARQEIILDTVHDGIVIIDREGYIINWNRAAERIFGYQKEQILGEAAGVLDVDLIAMTAHEDQWCGVINFTREDGTYGTCEATLVPLRDEHKNLIITVGVLHDTTQPMQAKKLSLQEVMI